MEKFFDSIIFEIVAAVIMALSLFGAVILGPLSTAAALVCFYIFCGSILLMLLPLFVMILADIRRDRRN